MAGSLYTGALGLPTLETVPCATTWGSSGEDVVLGRALAASPRRVGGKSTTTSTLGTFAVKGVSVPYDAAIASNATTATVYLGLTRTDPTLVAFGTYGPTL